MSRYVALLRGINVGGNNLIKMAALKQCFEKNGFEEVATYIQSGNVLFTSTEQNHAKLTGQIEKILSKTFGYRSVIVLRSRKAMREAVDLAPRGFGSEPSKYRYDVLFIKEPMTAAEVMKGVPIREGVDEVNAGPGVLYFSRLISRVTQSYISRMASMPVYQHMTIRNWNTTTKLYRMLEELPEK